MPERPLDIYLVAIGGTGMAPLACLLKDAGHRVRGVDGPLYPPMSTLLASAGIEPLVGYAPVHLEARPDLVVIGNAVPRSNVEALETERLEIPFCSMPQALGRFFLADRRPLVVAGTHGKTTTTSIAAWVYSACGRDPGYLIGGVPVDLGRSFAAGSGERFILEGDEYNAAYFDRGPKFLHYRAETLILTSNEHDHVDLYPSPESLTAAFAELVRQLPASGLLIACGDSEPVRALAEEAGCEVVFYGLGDGNDVRPEGEPSLEADGSRFTIADPEAGAVEIELQLAGRHNLMNAIAVWVAARRDGLAAADVARALGRFRGVQRRMEEVGSAAGVTVVDDFAHHPTAVGETLLALRQRYPERRLVVAFEPRSLTAGRQFLFDAYLDAFRAADVVHLAPIFHAERLGPDERLDRGLLVEELGRVGVEAHAHLSIDRLVGEAVSGSAAGDVFVTMSSGAFEDAGRRVLAHLADAD